MFAARQKAGPIAGALLSLVFSFLLVLTATADLFIAPRLPPGIPLRVAVRIPSIGVYSDTITGGASYRVLRSQRPRGYTLAPDELRMAQAYEDLRRPPSQPLLIGMAVAFFLTLLLYLSYLRVLSSQTALFRTQLSLLASLLVLAVGSKVLLSMTDWSAMWIPLAALIIPAGIHLGSRAAGATALAGSLALSLLTPLDLPLLAVLLPQGLAAGIVAGKKGRRLPALRGAIIAALTGGLGHVALSLLQQHFVPSLRALQEPTLSGVLTSDLVASVGGGLLGGVVTLFTAPLLGGALGIVSKAKLLELADFESPLLKQIATRAPGTWAHSLSMANMAEMAANAIGGDALLVRVGAYYHDLGKTVQPEYFIENQDGPNPHDALAPDVSADAIFAHITEGVKLARKHKLPSAVLEFICSHHGTGTLEYFWHKNMKQGNPKGLSEKDFQYPGCSPQRPETAILSICDAVEAASRTIKDPDLAKVQQLVRQIVFTKLEQRMLSESGLTIPELQRVVESLVETLRSSFHVRVKYPWQEERPDATGAPAPPSLPPSPAEQAVPLLSAKPAPEPLGQQPTVADVSRRDPSLANLPERGRVMTMPLGVQNRGDPTSGPMRPNGRGKG